MGGTKMCSSEFCEYGGTHHPDTFVASRWIMKTAMGRSGTDY